MLIIRGNNLYPTAVEAIIRQFREVAEFRVVARQSGELTALEVEIEPDPQAAPPGKARDALRERVAAALEKTLLFRVEVREVPPGSLPRFELKGRRFIRREERET
jgi:phenylacetate-CoA ligase